MLQTGNTKQDRQKPITTTVAIRTFRPRRYRG